ncbi:MAG: hypothetical protein ACE5KA_00210 [Nitrososphaerales archaeon]
MEGIVRDIVFMMIGMGAGMAASPFMMKRIKDWRTRRKVDSLLREIDQSKKEDAEVDASNQGSKNRDI